jgi:hypothetical protein
MSRQSSFLATLWRSARPDILAQYRDVAVMLNLFAIIVLTQAAFNAMRLLHVDPELLTILEFLHKWATVIVFALFLFTVVVRSIFVAMGALKSAEAFDE